VREGREPGPAEPWRDRVLMHGLGVSEEQLYPQIVAEPSFDALCRWLATVGGAGAARIEHVRALLAGEPLPVEVQRAVAAVEAAPPVLGAADLEHFAEHGWVILHEAIGEPERAAAEALLWRHLGMDPDDSDTWYPSRTHGIMVQLFQDPALEPARRSPRVHKAFAQLWGCAELLATTDRCGFNPPERPGHRFPGPRLHWDAPLTPPVPLGLQGVLYLTDTAAEQGAFTCVPGFHRRIDAWLEALPAGADPQRQDLDALGAVPVPGRGGDLVIWHHALPHGSRANRAARPRLVQYVKLFPPRAMLAS